MHHHWIESELSKLNKLILAVDDCLSEICEESLEEADAFGIFDSAEHTTGLGLFACQTYIATLCGALFIEKPKALGLGLGPKHSSGLPMIQIINHAANYWKHNNEWALDKSVTRQQAIHRAFDLIGFPIDLDYPLSGALTELSSPFPASLKQLIHILEDWKLEMYKAA